MAEPAAGLETAQPVYSKEIAMIAALRGVPLESMPAETAARAEEPYYWEDGGDEHPGVDKVVRHTVHWVAMRAVAVMELVGDFFTVTLGLTNSRYEWADTLAEQQREEREEREIAEERQARWNEIRALRAQEEGNGEEEEDLMESEEEEEEEEGAGAPVAVAEAKQ
jgi:hypothetical protein